MPVNVLIIRLFCQGSLWSHNSFSLSFITIQFSSFSCFAPNMKLLIVLWIDCGRRMYNSFLYESARNMILPPQSVTEGGCHFLFPLNKSLFDGSPSCELNKQRCSSGFSALNRNQSPQCELSVLVTNIPNLTACQGV